MLLVSNELFLIWSDLSAWFTKRKEVFWRHSRHQPLNHLKQEGQAKLLATHFERRQVKLPEEFLHGARSARLVIPRDEAGGFPLHLFQLVDVLL